MYDVVDTYLNFEQRDNGFERPPSNKSYHTHWNQGRYVCRYSAQDSCAVLALPLRLQKTSNGISIVPLMVNIYEPFGVETPRS